MIIALHAMAAGSERPTANSGQAFKKLTEHSFRLSQMERDASDTPKNVSSASSVGDWIPYWSASPGSLVSESWTASAGGQYDPINPTERLEEAIAQATRALQQNQGVEEALKNLRWAVAQRAENVDRGDISEQAKLTLQSLQLLDEVRQKLVDAIEQGENGLSQQIDLSDSIAMDSTLEDLQKADQALKAAMIGAKRVKWPAQINKLWSEAEKLHLSISQILGTHTARQELGLVVDEAWRSVNGRDQDRASEDILAALEANVRRARAWTPFLDQEADEGEQLLFMIQDIEFERRSMATANAVAKAALGSDSKDEEALEAALGPLHAVLQRVEDKGLSRYLATDRHAAEATFEKLHELVEVRMLVFGTVLAAQNILEAKGQDEQIIEDLEYAIERANKAYLGSEQNVVTAKRLSKDLRAVLPARRSLHMAMRNGEIALQRLEGEEVAIAGLQEALPPCSLTAEWMADEVFIAKTLLRELLSLKGVRAEVDMAMGHARHVLHNGADNEAEAIKTLEVAIANADQVQVPSLALKQGVEMHKHMCRNLIDLLQQARKVRKVLVHLEAVVKTAQDAYDKGCAMEEAMSALLPAIWSVGELPSPPDFLHQEVTRAIHLLDLLAEATQSRAVWDLLQKAIEFASQHLDEGQEEAIGILAPALHEAEKFFPKQRVDGAVELLSELASQADGIAAHKQLMNALAKGQKALNDHNGESEALVALHMAAARSWRVDPHLISTAGAMANALAEDTNWGKAKLELDDAVTHGRNALKIKDGMGLAGAKIFPLVKKVWDSTHGGVLAPSFEEEAERNTTWANISAGRKYSSWRPVISTADQLLGSLVHAEAHKADG